MDQGSFFGSVQETFSYDANGNQTKWEIGSRPNFTVTYRSTSTYDANGNEILREIDSGANGTVDARRIFTSTAVNGWSALFNDFFR